MKSNEKRTQKVAYMAHNARVRARGQQETSRSGNWWVNVFRQLIQHFHGLCHFPRQTETSLI